MWGAIVDKNGIVCHVAYSGNDLHDQWGVSRGIAMQKAFTAANVCKNDFAISTANLFAPTQPGSSLWGLQFSNSVNNNIAYKGKSSLFGSKKDPAKGGKYGGLIVFGGGLGLYEADSEGNAMFVGAIGVSGDTSCADHNIAWRVRDELGLAANLEDKNLGGVANGKDKIIYDINSKGESKSGFGHTVCSKQSKTIGEKIGAATN